MPLKLTVSLEQWLVNFFCKSPNGRGGKEQSTVKWGLVYSSHTELHKGGRTVYSPMLTPLCDKTSSFLHSGW